MLRESREYIAWEIDWLEGRLGDLGFSVYPSATNFILFETKDVGLTAAQLVEGALEYDVLLRNADSFFGLDRWHCRTAVRRREANEKLIEGLSRALN